MLVRNTKNIGIYITSVLKKLTISSLWGPKRPQEFLLRIMYYYLLRFFFFGAVVFFFREGGWVFGCSSNEKRKLKLSQPSVYRELILHGTKSTALHYAPLSTTHV